MKENEESEDNQVNQDDQDQRIHGFSNLMKQCLSSGWCTGMVTGFADMVVNYPAYGMSYHDMCGLPVTWQILHPRELYRGALSCGIGYIPAVMIQDGITSHLKAKFGFSSGSYAHNFAAFVSGGIGAIPMTIVGNMIVIQKKHQLNAYQGLCKLFRNSAYRYGFLGFQPTAVHDAIFALTMFGGIDTISPAFLGAFSTILSHPFSKIAAQMQDELSYSTWTVAKEIARKEGLVGFYRGSLWRGVSVIGSAYLVPFVSNGLKAWAKAESEERVTPRP